VTPQRRLDNFPIGVSRGSGEGMNTLGLERNSTLLNALVASRVMSSRSWGFWQGWTGVESKNQIDGNLIFGGYDAEKVTGPNITLSIKNSVIPDPNCFVVTITDIKMNLKNGSSPSLFGNNKGAAASACVEPHFDKLSLQESMWNAFLAISGSTYVDRSTSASSFWGMLIQADGA